MGSVKDLIRDDSLAGKLYLPPSVTEFGRGAWRVSGRFSVADLKHLIPPSEIPQKAEALTMMTAAFFEYLAATNPDIPACYLGVMDADGKVTDVGSMVQKGDKTNIIVMKLAHTPDSYCGGDLETYRADLFSGKLQCGVADIEAIFRAGLPLGSSTFKNICKAAGFGKEYENAATYGETAALLDRVRERVSSEGLSNFPKLEAILAASGLGTTIPNPGFMLDHPTYDYSTKFETAGDRVITMDEARKLSGLSDEGYDLWVKQIFPKSTKAQIEFSKQRGLVNIDGKEECVAYRRMPAITDFANNVDENRVMIEYTGPKGVIWLIPSNKEIQRAAFRQAGVYAAIDEAKETAQKAGKEEEWKNYVPAILQARHIDIREVTKHSCDLMAYAVAEVANRILERNIFETAPMERWVPDFLPYASRMEQQQITR